MSLALAVLLVSPSVCLFIRPLVRPSSLLSVYRSDGLSWSPSVCLPVPTFVHLSVSPYVSLSVCQSIRLSVCPSVCLSVPPYPLFCVSASVCLFVCPSWFSSSVCKFLWSRTLSEGWFNQAGIQDNYSWDKTEIYYMNYFLTSHSIPSSIFIVEWNFLSKWFNLSNFSFFGLSYRKQLLSLCPYIRSSACPSVRLSGRLSIYRSDGLFICPSIRLSCYQSVHLSTCYSVRLSVIRLSVSPFVLSPLPISSSVHMFRCSLVRFSNCTSACPYA